MTTAVLPNGMQYAIPNSDIVFFRKMAKKMGWKAYKAGIQVTLVENKTMNVAAQQDIWSKYKISPEVQAMTFKDRKDIPENYESELQENLIEKYT